MENNFDQPEVVEPLPEKEEVKKEYLKPQLLEMGDLRTVTLGGSPGAGDSGPGGIPEVSMP